MEEVESLGSYREYQLPSNYYTDNMISCESEGCSYYFYDFQGKYRYCESCRSKDMC